MKGFLVPLLIVFMTGTVIGQQRFNGGTGGDETASVLNRQSNDFSPLSDRQSESGSSIFAPIDVPQKTMGPTPDDSFDRMTDSDSSTTVRQSATGDPQPDMFYVATERGDLETLMGNADVSLGVDIVPVDRATGKEMPLSYATGVVLALDVNNGKRLPYQDISPIRLYKNDDGENVIRFELSDDEINSLLGNRLRYSFSNGQRGQVDRVEFSSASAIHRARQADRESQNSNSIVSRNDSVNGVTNGLGDSRVSIPMTGLAVPGDFNFEGPVQPASPFARQKSDGSDLSNFQDPRSRPLIDLPERRETNSFSGGFTPPGSSLNQQPVVRGENRFGQNSNQNQNPISNDQWLLEQERQRVAQEKAVLEQQKVEFERKQAELAWQQQQQRLRQPSVAQERFTDNSTQFGGSGQQQFVPIKPLEAPPLKRTQDDIDVLANNDRFLNQKLDQLIEAVSGNNIRQVSMQTKMDPSGVPVSGGGLQGSASQQNGDINRGERFASLDQRSNPPPVSDSNATKSGADNRGIPVVEKKKSKEADQDAVPQMTFLLLVASIGLNIYLGVLCRSLYARYNELGDELRETFSMGLSRD